MTVVFRYCNKLETFDKVKGIPSSDAFAPFKKRCVVSVTIVFPGECVDANYRGPFQYADARKAR